MHGFSFLVHEFTVPVQTAHTYCTCTEKLVQVQLSLLHCKTSAHTSDTELHQTALQWGARAHTRTHYVATYT